MVLENFFIFKNKSPQNSYERVSDYLTVITYELLLVWANSQMLWYQIPFLISMSPLWANHIDWDPTIELYLLKRTRCTTSLFSIWIVNWKVLNIGSKCVMIYPSDIHFRMVQIRLFRLKHLKIVDESSFKIQWSPIKANVDLCLLA